MTLYLLKQFNIIIFLCMIFLTGCQAKEEEVPAEWSKYAHPPCFMMNGEMFYSSAHTVEGPFYEKDYVLVGTIQAMFEDYNAPLSDFESYEIPVGEKIYQNPDIPHQAYVETNSWKFRYRTKEAGRGYIFYNNQLFVSILSLDPQSEESNYYETIFETGFLFEIPEGSVYVGESKFIGYDTFPKENLGTNAFRESCALFRDVKDSSVLYLDHPADGYIIFVPKK